MPLRRHLQLIKASVICSCQFKQSDREDTMDRLWVTIACLLLKVTFEPSTAAVLLEPSGCPACPRGYFMTRNCSENNEKRVGIQCKLCTDCSVSHQETLVECSTVTDSVCGNKTNTTTPPTEMPTRAPVPAPDTWIILTAIVVSVFLILLLSLFLTLVSCRHQQGNHKGLDLL